ncbi:DUF5805 domain-containing protein [Haloferacaceae archaeon DSL9]
MDTDTDTSRKSVKTYVPAYQKAIWEEHADELGMSQSEFVRTMVQAGRRGFEGAPGATETSSPETTTGGDDELEAAVRSVLASREYLSWDELVEAVAGDLESSLEALLDELQADNVVRYSGRRGGYTLAEDRR